MEVTPIGWVLIPLGLISFIFRPNWLLFLAIFFVPFSATAIINHGTGDTASGFSPYLFFGALFVLRKFVRAARKMAIKVPRSIEAPFLLLLLFALICLLSLAMPALIGGRLYIMSTPNLDYSLVPLQYTPQIVAHAFSLIFEVSMVVLIAKLGTDSKSFRLLVKTYLASGVFVCLWGWMQFSFYLVGIPYPSQVFNNNASPYALGYGATVGVLNILRVSSVALEPSALARVLVAMAAMSLMAVYNKSYILGRSWDVAILILFTMTIIISTSSTGYVGLTVLPLLLLVVPSPCRGRKIVVITTTAVILCTIGVLYFTVPVVGNVLDFVLLNKAGAGSVAERQVIIGNDLQYFLRYPILGVGWDTAPTHDVVIGMLTHCGVLGLAAFLFLIGWLALRLRESCSLVVRTVSTRNSASMMLVCLLNTCAVFAVSGGIEPPDFWLVLGLSIAAVGMGRSARRPGIDDREGIFALLRVNKGEPEIPAAAL